MVILSSRASSLQLDQSLLHRRFMFTIPSSDTCCVLKIFKLSTYVFLDQDLDYARNFDLLKSSKTASSCAKVCSVQIEIHRQLFLWLCVLSDNRMGELSCSVSLFV
jgi:hypothetical protein